MHGPLGHPKTMKMTRALFWASVERNKGTCRSLGPLKKTRGLSG
jgi:hypothetical protein